MRARIGTAVCVLALALTSGCARLTEGTGYIPDAALLDEIVVGLDTKTTIRRIIGPPGTTGLVTEDAWYYVESDYERFLWRAPVEVDREVLALSFDDAGRVRNIERFGLEDGRIVVLSRRVTSDNTEGVSFLRQLFSNVTNFDPGKFLN